MTTFDEAVNKARKYLNIGPNGSKKVYYSQGNNSCKIEKAEELDTENNLLSQYLLFGETENEIISFPWIQASWKYIDKFRCPFGFTIAEAMFYPTITIVGTPDLLVPVSKEQENLIKESFNTLEDFQIERLWVKTPEELSILLEERIVKNQSFYGGDVGPYAPNI